MKVFSTGILSGACTGPSCATMLTMSEIIEQHPVLAEFRRDGGRECEAILSRHGFLLYPTVPTTTLFYDAKTDTFCKILLPRGLKGRLRFMVTDRARAVWRLSEDLAACGIKAAEVTAYATIKRGGMPFFISRRLAGESLYDLAVRKGSRPDIALCVRVIDQVVRLHRLGYWLGDAHLSHIFVEGAEVTGFIDIDGIRRNRPFRLKNLAKDLAGLNHPGLSLEAGERDALVDRYLKSMAIRDRTTFQRLVVRYTERRWKRSA